jgi:hypothetical protein
MPVGTPRHLGYAMYDGEPGSFWAWPVDGYYDIHVTTPGTSPDGSDVVSEFHPTLADARRWVREIRALNRFVETWTGEPR